jgi:hypothetical protein
MGQSIYYIYNKLEMNLCNYVLFPWPSYLINGSYKSTSSSRVGTPQDGNHTEAGAAMVENFEVQLKNKNCVLL